MLICPRHRRSPRRNIGTVLSMSYGDQGAPRTKGVVLVFGVKCFSVQHLLTASATTFWSPHVSQINLAMACVKLSILEASGFSHRSSSSARGAFTTLQLLQQKHSRALSPDYLSVSAVAFCRSMSGKEGFWADISYL